MVKRINNISDDKEFLTPEEVADILRINVLTVYSYIQKDNLDAVRLGKIYRISRKDLDSFIKSKRLKTNPKKIQCG